MNSFTNIKGGKEVQEFLNTLAPKIERNIMRSALRAGAKVIAAEARRIVPKKTGKLAETIKVTTKSKNGKVAALVKTKYPTSHLIEFGTRPHYITSKRGLNINGVVRKVILHPGSKPYPFMRPAFDRKTGEAINAVGKRIQKRLTKEGLESAPLMEVDE